MGKGFRMERAPTADHPTCLLFATGSGISPIKALIESNELQVWAYISYGECLLWKALSAVFVSQ